MKRWQIVYGLPLEVWVEIFSFPWISRQEFGQLVHKIGNFKFAEHAQFFLHEWGKRMLRGLVYNQQDGLFKFLISKPPYFHRLDVPQTPLPENIKSFDKIAIDHHFDATTMAFLGQIRSLLTDVELTLHGECRTVLTNLVPFLDGIHTLRCTESTFAWMEQHLRENLTNLKVLGITPSAVPANAINWLIQPEEGADNGPKLCVFRFYQNHGIYEQILQAIRQQFLAAKTTRTYAVNLMFFNWTGQVAGFHLENGIGEQLQGVWNGNEKVFQITRHQANCGTELQEWIRENTKETNRGRIYYSQNYAITPCCPNGCAMNLGGN